MTEPSQLGRALARANTVSTLRCSRIPSVNYSHLKAFKNLKCSTPERGFLLRRASCWLGFPRTFEERINWISPNTNSFSVQLWTFKTAASLSLEMLEFWNQIKGFLGAWYRLPCRRRASVNYAIKTFTFPSSDPPVLSASAFPLYAILLRKLTWKRAESASL